MEPEDGSKAERIAYEPDVTDDGFDDAPTSPESRAWRDPFALQARECHFLAPAYATGGSESPPEPRACLAFRDPLPLSERQRQLVCLTSIHETCPRYLRSTVVEPDDTDDADGEGRRRRLRVSGFALAGVVSIVALAAALLWVLPSLPSFFAAASTSSAFPTARATASVTAGPTARATATVSPTIGPSTKPTPTPTPRGSASWPPGATSSRMQLVTPCAGQSGCYLYTIRPKDTFLGIVTYFGVPRETVLAMNPSIANPDRIVAGQVIRIPPPTR